jgi:hypothetical protein
MRLTRIAGSLGLRHPQLAGRQSDRLALAAEVTSQQLWLLGNDSEQEARTESEEHQNQQPDECSNDAAGPKATAVLR